MIYTIAFFKNGVRTDVATFTDDMNGALNYAAGFAEAIAMTDAAGNWLFNNPNDNREWLTENNPICIAYDKRTMSVLNNSVMITIDNNNH